MTMFLTGTLIGRGGTPNHPRTMRNDVSELKENDVVMVVDDLATHTGRIGLVLTSYWIPPRYEVYFDSDDPNDDTGD